MATHCHTEYAAQKKTQLEDSLWDLMLCQPYKEISVTDICRKADIPRRTFYHYFESKDDILDAMIESLMQQCFLSSVYGLHIDPARIKEKESFIRIFQFWNKENRIKLDALIQNGLESRLMGWSFNFIQSEKIGLLNNSSLDPKLVEIGLMVGVTDFFSLLLYWSRKGYQETPEQMAEYAVWVLPQAFYNL